MMRTREIKLGEHYVALVSDLLTVVRVDSTSIHGGWNTTNPANGCCVWINTATEFRYPAGLEWQHAKGDA